MSMDLTGIYNRNEYYTNHYFASIFEENAADTIRRWQEEARGAEQRTPWALLREVGKHYFILRSRQERRRGDEAYESMVTQIAQKLLSALGYQLAEAKPELVEINGAPAKVPIAFEVSKSNGAPLLWTILASPKWDAELALESIEDSEASDIMGYAPFEADLRPNHDRPFEGEMLLREPVEEILGRLLYDLDESPRWILLISDSQVALIDRNKWNEKRFLVFDLNEIFSRSTDSTLQAMAVLLHCESLCPADGGCLLDTLDDNSHKHASGVSRDLKYALRQCIEILGNEVVYDMRERQHVGVFGRALAEDLTLQCLRYMYRILFMLFIEAKPELGYAPMKAQTYESGYSFESLREICEQAVGDGEINEDGNFLKNSLDKLFSLIYNGFPTETAIAADDESLQGVFAIDPLKAHIFDPERTALIEKAHLRNSKLLQIINLMSLSRGGKGQRRGRISYSNLGVNQLGAVYEALLSYRGFFAEEDLYEVKRAGDKVDELDVGYFIPLRDLDQYTEDERVRNEDGTLRVHPKGEFIYRLAGREREKSASYYTPEVLTRCLVKYALKELLQDKKADEILELTICEPAMGSAAFLNEAVSQLAEAYLDRKQKETGSSLTHDQRQQELQKVKMLIADRNVYGIDLNPTAVELAEVSLWLNTIYQGGYVPWFRTQIVNGNSLIGARRQCYTLSQAQAEGPAIWYNSAPERIEPGKQRSLRKGQIYHFLLGDPGMCAYTDKVIKELEPEKIATIKKWVKDFTRPLNDSEVDDVLRLCNQIDTLWDAHTKLRAEIKEKTTDPLSVWGQVQDEEHQRTTIRDKDRIYDNLYLSKGGSNASPYARLKAVMDYWCALWFWPIDKADELPTRTEFLFDVQMLLGLDIVNTHGDKWNKSQISWFDDTDLDPYARELSSRYGKYGAVNLDQLRADFPRLRIANEVAEQQRFFHWELEFSDVFEERGGFDLVVGNPPWIKLEWNEEAVLGDKNPVLIVKDYKAAQINPIRPGLLNDEVTYNLYLDEYESMTGQQVFLNAVVNYPLLRGQQTNLFRCFLPQAWEFSCGNGITAFLHPEGIYDDPKAGILRNVLYRRLRKHFQFQNELMLFPEVAHRATFSINIYGSYTKVGFDTISNLFSASTIDECYSDDPSLRLYGFKDDNDNWSIQGHPDRIVHVGKRELGLFGKLFDGSDDAFSARLPVIHAKQLLQVLSRFAETDRAIDSIKEDILATQMWQETYSQADGTIKRNVCFPETLKSLIYSGPHLGVGNPLFKTPRAKCVLKSDFDPIDLLVCSKNYRQRTNYTPACSSEKYNNLIQTAPWGAKYDTSYRLVMRRMLNQSGERTLIAAVVPPETAHIHTMFGMQFKTTEELCAVATSYISLPFDFYVKSTGKSDILFGMASNMPYLANISTAAIARMLLLNCLTSNYSALWKESFNNTFIHNEWAKRDHRLAQSRFTTLTSTWTWDTPLRTDYERRQALVEIDVLTAIALGMTLDQLKTIYRIQFPVLQQYEADTWYDANGRIVFTTNRSLTGVGVSRNAFEKPGAWQDECRLGEAECEIADGATAAKFLVNKASYSMKDAPKGLKFLRTITDDTQPGGPIQRTIEYVAPFDRCDREKDYETAWEFFSRCN